jgi:hypothetical protein
MMNNSLKNIEGVLSVVPNLSDEIQEDSLHSTGEIGWGASRAESKADEKELLAKYFCEHDLLVPEYEDSNDERETVASLDERETVASIIVNQGSTPDRVVAEVLQWIKEQNIKEREKEGSQGKSFFLSWYTPGHLIPTTLKNFRDHNWALRTATKLFLFPGEVDEEWEAVSGPDAEEFANQLERHFTYAFLSAYAFDVSTGSVYFISPRELLLQKACATRWAAHKFLFLDSSKFKREGEKGYDIWDLLDTADKVTVYTASLSSDRDISIKAEFDQLCANLLRENPSGSRAQNKKKTLRLKIVGRNHTPTTGTQRKGYLVARIPKRKK